MIGSMVGRTAVRVRGLTRLLGSPMTATCPPHEESYSTGRFLLERRRVQAAGSSRRSGGGTHHQRAWDKGSGGSSPGSFPGEAPDYCKSELPRDVKDQDQQSVNNENAPKCNPAKTDCVQRGYTQRATRKPPPKLRLAAAQKSATRASAEGFHSHLSIGLPLGT
jgi:hypothetical protein